jgi:hypothetical protein
MKFFWSFLLVAILLFAGCHNKKKFEINESLLEYPLFENCDEQLSNTERLQCLGEKLPLFYHYYLTHDYAQSIFNKEDSLVINLVIDTTGKMQMLNIDFTHSQMDKDLDSILKIITKQSPIFVPAKYNNKKIPFYLKLPVILTKNEKND